MTASPSKYAGGRVRHYRHRKGWSQVRLAIQCSMAGYHKLTPTVLVHIEDQKRGRKLTLEEVWALAEVLEVSPADLMPSLDYPATSTPGVAVDVKAVQGLVHQLAEEFHLTKKETSHGGH